VRSTARLIFAATVFAGAAAGSVITLSTPGYYDLDPRAGFIYAAPNDEEQAPVVVDLAADGLVAGDVINISGEGSMCYVMYPGCPASSAWIAGAFDTNDQLLSQANQNRLPGGIASSTFGQQNINVPWLNSYYGNVDTTIPSDFTIPYGNGVTLTIPTGANYLFLGVMDSYYADNGGDVGVKITLLVDPPPPGPPPVLPSGPPATAPEPGTWVLLLTGIALIAFRRARLGLA